MWISAPLATPACPFLLPAGGDSLAIGPLKFLLKAVWRDILTRMKTHSAQQSAETIIRRLTDAGFLALLAGGCVRDLLLGREPEDYDIATDARPEEICQLYPRAQKVGAHFGVVIVRQFGHPIEVATFRADGPYTDGRHPQTVTFTTAEEDARRRDFTINGMFYDPIRSCVIDYVGGQEDLKKRIIRAIGEPRRRFEEDHLRMIRAIRFASRLEFEIEPETFSAIRGQAAMLRRVSPERVREELEKILTDPHRSRGFELLRQTTLLHHLGDEPSWTDEQLDQIALAMADLPAKSSFSLALAVLLHFFDPSQVGAICRKLTCSNKIRKETVWLVQQLGRLNRNEIRTLADLKLLIVGPCFDDLISFYHSVLHAHHAPTQPADDLQRRAAALPPETIAPEPFVNGDDLIQLGLQQGPRFKKILDETQRKRAGQNRVMKIVAE